MNKEQEGTAAKRRTFLKLAGLGTIGGAAAAIAGTGAAEAKAAPETAGRGYRETEHVKKVYELARF